MTRWVLSFIAALQVVLVSFAFILWMISPRQAPAHNEPLQVGHFIPMSKQSTDTQPRSRLQAPEPPPDVEPPKPKTPQHAPTTPQIKLDLAAPNISSSIRISAQAMPSLDVQATPAAAAPAPVSAPSAPAVGADSEVTPLNDVLPEYPDMARRRGIEGHVKLAFTINAKGRVENIQVIEAQPRNVFDRAARRAAARWRFHPKMDNGVAVPRRVEKVIEFQLAPAR